MPDAVTVIRDEERPVVDFPGGATYRTLIGDDNGAGIPIRTGIQTSQPGYADAGAFASLCRGADRPRRAGRSLAGWSEGDEAGTIAMEPGVTISIPAGRVHGFRVIGDKPLVTYGIHTFGKRIVNYQDDPAAS